MIDKRDKRKKIYLIYHKPRKRDNIKLAILMWKRFFRNRNILGKLQFQEKLFYSYVIFENLIRSS